MSIKVLLDEFGFGRLFSAIRDAVVVVEASSGLIVLWNEAAESLFGYSVEEAVGMELESLVPPELKAKHREGLAGYARTGSGRVIGSHSSLELPALHKTGQTIYVDLMLSPIESISRPGRFVMGIVRDVTEKHQAEIALRTGREKLEQALEQQKVANEKLVTLDNLKNEFIQIVAHDLRSPMSVISGFAQTLVESWDDFADPTKRDFMARIASSVDNLSQLVEDVLQVARLEGGEFTYEQEVFDLVEVVRRTVDEISVGLPEGRIEIDAPEPLPDAVADQHRQWQILSNLLSNALKFSSEESPVVISIREQDSMLHVRVRDRGVGIAPGDLERVFEKFSRIHPKGMRKPKGTGLGLYICRSMVEAQGGRIWLESEIGKGTCVEYTVPTKARA